MTRWILLLVICLFAAPAWSQSLQDLERLAQQHRLTTQEGTPVSFRPDRGGLLLMFGCEGCRHSHEDEEELQMILKRFADQSMQIVIAPLPADHFPGKPCSQETSWRQKEKSSLAAHYFPAIP